MVDVRHLISVDQIGEGSELLGCRGRDGHLHYREILTGTVRIMLN